MSSNWQLAFYFKQCFLPNFNYIYHILEEQQRNKNLSSIKEVHKKFFAGFQIKGKQIFKAPLQTSCVNACIKWSKRPINLFACIWNRHFCEFRNRVCKCIFLNLNFLKKSRRQNFRSKQLITLIFFKVHIYADTTVCV